LARQYYSDNGKQQRLQQAKTELRRTTRKNRIGGTILWVTWIEDRSQIDPPLHIPVSRQREIGETTDDILNASD
jgi:hypothetical protein